jgi:osmotically-inducible protein OsmY
MTPSDRPTLVSQRRPRSRWPALSVLLAATLLASACVPVVIGGAMVGGALAVTDRRTTGTQLEDQSIELKAMTRTRELLGDRGQVSHTSYNRIVLLTGEVPTDADRNSVEQAIGRIDNVRGVVNELAVMGPSSLTSRANDRVLSTKVKATFVDAKDVAANAFKVTAERGTVYLMGRVTEREAQTAVELARSVPGVQRVVKVLEYISEAELQALQPPTQSAR